MRPNADASVLRFIDSNFDCERTSAQVNRLLPGARGVSFNVLSLRDIFVVLAKASRKPVS